MNKRKLRKGDVKRRKKESANLTHPVTLNQRTVSTFLTKRL